jgi:glycosyltransferase involved in cell wall biosynthesis
MGISMGEFDAPENKGLRNSASPFLVTAMPGCQITASVYAQKRHPKRRCCCAMTLLNRAYEMSGLTTAPVPVPSVQQLRVAVVSETYPPEVNGVALTVATLVRSLVQARHAVLVVRPAQASEDSTAPGVEQMVVPGARLPRYPALRFGWPVYWRLLARFRQWRPQALYIATEGPLGWAALLAARKLGIPVASGFHTRFDDFVGHYGLGFLRSTAFAYLRAFHNRAQATLVPTRLLDEELTRGGFRNVRILERGVDSQLFRPSRRSAQLRRDWGVDDSELAVLFVGRVAPEKNLDLTIQAFDAIRAQGVAAKMIWVGDGPARAEYQARYPDHRWCGMQRGEALAAHFASADIFLFASLTETFGNVTLEALASGLPVVAFAYGAAGQHIADGVEGRTVAVGDHPAFITAAAQLAVDPARKTMATAARQNAEALSMDAVGEHFIAILSELAQRAAASETSRRSA